METKLTDKSIEQAAYWYARLLAPDCSQEEREVFHSLLKTDPGFEQAFRSAERVARLINIQQDDPRMQALAAAALEEKAPRSRMAVPLWQGLVSRHLPYAAALFLMIGVVLLSTYLNQEAVVSHSQVVYVNDELREQHVVLSDGSVLHLDVNTKVTVLMNPRERQLKLDRGRAYFEVAHDVFRPFSVSAAGTRVVALGTRFQVDMIFHEQVNVTLAEGSVAVTSDADPDGWRDVLRPGQQLRVDRSLNRREKFNVNADTVTSWSGGLLVFDGTPLHQVLNEFNRYAAVKVLLGDNSLANVPIGGNFVAGGDSREFVETLTAVLPLRSVRTGANEIALFKLYETHNP